MGADFWGSMASSQRVYNLFRPLLENPDVSLVNVSLIERDKLHNLYVEKYAAKRFNPFSWIVYLYKINGLLRRYYKPNSVNVLYFYNYPFILDVVCLYLAKRCGYKVVFDITENLTSLKPIMFAKKMKLVLYKCVIHFIPKLADIIFVISTSLEEYVANLCKRKIPIYLLPISVDVEIIGTYKDNNLSNIGSQIKVFYGGSFGDKDGFPLLLEAFKRAREKNPHLKLILTGKVSKESERIVSLLLSENDLDVQYLGCLPIDNYYSTMANCDIMCMIRVGSEFANAGFPFKLGEFLASKNAVIATNVGDVGNYVRHMEDVYLIEPDSVDQIYKAIIELSSDVSLREKLGRNGYEIAKLYFASQKVSRFLYSIICQL